MVQYDDFAETFGRSRDGLHWAEIDRLLLHFVGSYTNPQWDIADIGCGNGRLLEHIVSSDIVTDFRDHKTRYIGVDLSQKLLSQAREKTINQLGISTEWILGDMTDIGTVLSGHFDAVFLIASFHHLVHESDRVNFLHRIKAHLKPQGRIYMTNWNLIHETQSRYASSVTMNYDDGSADFLIKIGEHDRFYHAFSESSFTRLIQECGYSCELCDFTDRNSLSILKLDV